MRVLYDVRKSFTLSYKLSVSVATVILIGLFSAVRAFASIVSPFTVIEFVLPLYVTPFKIISESEPSILTAALALFKAASSGR